MEKITVKKYDLSSQDSYKSFQKIKTEFLHLLSEAFANKYFGDKIYTKKINARNLVVYIALDQTQLVGALLVKDRQKLSGLAVLESHRRKKIASQLCRQAQSEIVYLYGEVDITNIFIRDLLEKLHFKSVKNKATIRKLLTTQKDELTFLDCNKNYCSYKHLNRKYDLDQLKTFVMYHYKSAL